MTTALPDSDRESGAGLEMAFPTLASCLPRPIPKQRRAVFDAFRLSVEIDRNSGQLRLKALVSSAFSQARDLKSLVANGGVAEERLVLSGAGGIPIGTVVKVNPGEGTTLQI